jgi:hypothetical protein
MAVPSSVLPEIDALRRLQQLGLEEADLREAMRIGYNHAASCTDHDPRALPGTLAWAKGTGDLRDRLKVRKWRADRNENFESVVHPDGRHAVAIMAGTSQTGRADGLPPRTKTPRGPATDRAVQANRQLSFAGADPAFGPLPEDGRRTTWLLLHYYDRDEKEIRLELSLPSEMTGKQVTAWQERILLQTIPFATKIVDFDEVEAAEINVDVTRRQFS